MVGYGKPIKTNATVDLNSQWVSDTTDDEYKYFKSASYKTEVDEDGFSYSYSQCKVTWSNLTSITFKCTSNGDTGELEVLKMDSEKFTGPSSFDDIYLSLFDETPGTYNEFTIECDKGEHHIWFCYLKNPKSATDEDCGFIGVPKSVSPVLDVKQGSELPTEYKFGGVSAEDGKTYNISFNNVTLPNDNIVTVYEDFQKVEKTITYEYVDLGLSVKWATCNIGASSETEDGVFFQWGETNSISKSLVGKYSDENYSWESYTHGGPGNTLTKYNTDSSRGTVDNIEILESVDDAATQIMGDEWRMPTKADFQELIDKTNHMWVTNFNGSGVDGCKFTSKKDTSKYIFIPATVKYADGNPHGNIWSSSLATDHNTVAAWFLGVDKKGFGRLGYGVRDQGFMVRGVHN